jgi:cytochrome P450
MTTSLALIERDWFTDHEVHQNPYPWFEAMRALGPIAKPPGRDYFVVTGFEEALDIWRRTDDFSAVNSLQGAGAPLPFEATEGDFAAQLEANRDKFIGYDQVVNMDDKPHQLLRGLINKLFTPSRLKANEAYITDYADRLIREKVAQGRVDMISEIATPFVTVVVADLLGVPADDRQFFMDTIAKADVPGSLDSAMDFSQPDHPFVVMGTHFAGYVMDRMANPREDILTELTHAEFSDGTKPTPLAIIGLGMFMFGAGQDTSAKLLGNAMRYIIDEPGLQDQLRADPSLIPALIEEVLRLEGSTKQTARLARSDCEVGGVKIPAGSAILLGLSAANRDPRRWEAPDELRLDRPRIKEHVAFGRGAHTCAGAPLARVEVRVLLEKLLEHTSHIDLDETRHGSRGNRRFKFEPSFIIRGLDDLQLVLTPKG